MNVRVPKTRGALSFPWGVPFSSNSAVLRTVPICAETGAYSLSVRLAAFEAVRRGRAAITAPLTPEWQSLSPRDRRNVGSRKATVIVES